MVLLKNNRLVESHDGVKDGFSSSGKSREDNVRLGRDREGSGGGEQESWVQNCKSAIL